MGKKTGIFVAIKLRNMNDYDYDNILEDNLTLCMMGDLSCLFFSLLIFFQNQFFQKIISEIFSECEIVWI